jgi:O-antigen/teichoic acid export membrane protein
LNGSRFFFVSSNVNLSTEAQGSASQLTSRHGTLSLSKLLLYGSATVGMAVGLERGLGFLSGVLAARVAGPQAFGAYSIVFATAGTVAAYAGTGIGTTATRFSGQYGPESDGYRRFILALVVIAASSATVATILMFVGAGPLARWVLRNEALVSFLRIAAVSSGAIVLLECVRGLLVGQQKFHALLLASGVSGICLIIALPLAATIGPGLMIAAQAASALIGVFIILVLSKQFGLTARPGKKVEGGPGIGPVLKFGLVQFGAYAGISIASWWIASLVARSDGTLTEMGLYAIANQFRGLAVLAPNLCGLVGYSLLTEESGSKYGGAGRVMLVNSFLAAAMATLAAGVGIVFAPWLVTIIYGKSFSGAEIPVTIVLATGILHMTALPAALRLSIVGIRITAIINAVWAALLVVVGIWLIPKAGATGAALAFLVSHLTSQLLVIAVLARMDHLPKGYLALFAVTTLGGLLLAGAGYWRATAINQNLVTIAVAFVAILMLAAVCYVGQRTGCLPHRISNRLSR